MKHCSLKNVKESIKKANIYRIPIKRDPMFNFLLNIIYSLKYLHIQFIFLICVFIHDILFDFIILLLKRLCFYL